MVLTEDSHPHYHSSSNISAAPCSETRPYYYYTPPPSSAKFNRPMGRSMRTIRPKIFQPDGSAPIADKSNDVSENLTASYIDLRLSEFANKLSVSSKAPCSSSEMNEFSEISRAFSDFSACSSDISGELQRLASVPEAADSCQNSEPESELESGSGFLLREMLPTEIVETISPEDLQPTVKLCVDGLQSSSAAVKRSAASKLRLLAKNRADYRELIGESGAIPALVPLLRCSDPMSQEHAVTALLNLSLHESNKNLITNAGAVKSLIYVLKTGTESSKQNAACALLSLALIEDNKLSIGACGAIPPLVALLINGSNRGKKDALTTLYKLCSARLNKERAVTAGAVRPLVGLVGEQGSGLAEKVMAVLSSLAGIEIGCKAIVEEGGISTLLEVIEDGSDKGKEFAVLTLLQLCRENIQNREFLVREGGIPPLVALSQSGTAKAKHKAEALLQCLREQRFEASSSNP